MKSVLQRMFNPKILVPAIFAIVLIGFVLSLGDLQKVGSDIVNFPRGDAAVFFLLIIIYEVARLTQWMFFLRRMDVKIGLRRGVFAFVGGEATKSLPAGNYFQNYLLEREKGVAVAYTAASTTFTILLEVSICVLYVAIVGIGGWNWIRPLLIGGVLVVSALAVLIARLDLHANPPHWLGKRKAFQWLTEQWKTFAEGAKSFFSFKVVAIGWLLSLAYLTAAGTNYYIVIRAIGIQNVSYWGAVAAYLFGLGVGLILPVPTDIGVQEISGVGVLKALGVETTRAVSVTLIFRILNLVSSFVVALFTFIILHKELGEALSSRHGSGKVPGDHDGTPDQLDQVDEPSERAGSADDPAAEGEEKAERLARPAMSEPGQRGAKE